MLRYVPVNLAAPERRPPAPVLAQATPAKPEPPAGVPSVAVNLIIMATGVGIGLYGFYHHKRPFGALAMGMGGSVAGVGLVFTVLDLLGFRPPKP